MPMAEGRKDELLRHSIELEQRAQGLEDVIVVAPHFARALIASDLGDGGPDSERRVRYALTDDRDVVVRVGRALMLQITALAGSAAERFAA